MVSTLASGPSCPRFDSQFPQKKIVDVAKVNQWCCLEESVLWLENMDQITQYLLVTSQYSKKLFKTIGDYLQAPKLRICIVLQYRPRSSSKRATVFLLVPSSPKTIPKLIIPKILRFYRDPVFGLASDKMTGIAFLGIIGAIEETFND